MTKGLRSTENVGSTVKKAGLKHLLLRFRMQLLVWFILIILIPSIVISLIYTVNNTAGQLERQEKLLSQQANDYGVLLDNRMNSVVEDARSIMTNGIISDYLTYHYLKPEQQVKDAIYFFQPTIRWLLSTKRQYLRIHFLTDSKYTSGDPYVDGIDEYRDKTWVRHTLVSDISGYWQSRHAPQPFRYSKLAGDSASYSLKLMMGGEGIVLLDIDMQWLYQNTPIVLSDDGKVIFSNFPANSLGEEVSLERDGKLLTAQIGGTEYYIMLTKNNQLGVQLLACIEKSGVSRTITQNNVYFLAWLTLSNIGTLILVLIMSGFVTRRMSIIHNNINLIAQGNYDVAFIVRHGDEIDELGAAVVNMSKQMNRMVNQELKQQMLLRETEFRALQQQINPHFIFNILETMQMMAEINEQRQLAEFVAQFGRMVRYNLYADRNVVLADELENALDYLSLQKLLFNDELSVEIDCNDEDMDAIVPRLILQPLVENAVVHGKIKGQMLIVRISVQHCTDGLRIRIYNNGRCLTKEKQRLVNETLSNVVRDPNSVDASSMQDNLALINIQKRLNIYFGSGCIIQIANTDDGVAVQFTVSKSRSML